MRAGTAIEAARRRTDDLVERRSIGCPIGASATDLKRRCPHPGIGRRRVARVDLPAWRAMIERYTRPELGAVWTDEARMSAWRDVEVAAAEALDGPTPDDLEAIRAATFTVEAVKERERVTDHDVAAFVDVLAASAGPAGRWIHYGLTSSDVLDTALALQLRRAGEIVVPGARALAAALVDRAREHGETLCVGRTHGVHAEPTSFGLKLAGFAFEAHRNAERLERAFAQAAVGAISGAVGTYASLGPDYERRVLHGLDLAAEPVSTQVVPRDRHAELVQAIALAGAGLERFATEVRHLQRTEVREVEEPFRAGQKGSSAMPHKRNPIVTERITGLARLLRGYAQAAVENVALWHERDISHSGAERVLLPDATIVLDYAQHLALRVVRGMTVHADRMRANLELTCGALFSQRVLLALVDGGMQRDDAYRIVQRRAQEAWDSQTPLRTLLEREPDVDLDLDAIFDYGHYTRHVPEVLARLEVIRD
jgi:adenylosuccinate lyase